MEKKTKLNHKIIYYSEFRDMVASNAWVQAMTVKHNDMELVASMIKKQERFEPSVDPDTPPVSEFIIVSQLEFQSVTE